MNWLSLILLITFTANVFSAPLSKTNESQRVLVLRGGTLFDAHLGRMVPNQTIIIRGERIEKVGPPNLAKLPRGARILDVRGKFILPGLIDAHVHIVHQLNDAHLTGEQVLPMFLAAGVTAPTRSCLRLALRQLLCLSPRRTPPKTRDMTKPEDEVYPDASLPSSTTSSLPRGT